MRKRMLALTILILFATTATTIQIPDVNVTGVNITGLMISVATRFFQVMKFIVKEALLTIANML